MKDSGYKTKISQRNSTLLDSLVSRLKQSSDVLFADYRGLSVAQVQTLRAALKAEGAVISVVKNRIAHRAFQTLGADSACQSVLVGPTALVLSKDDGLPALRVLVAFKKENKENDALTVKGSIIAKTFYDAARTAAVSALPSRELLLTQLVCTVQAPVRQLVSLLHAIVSRPVIVLNEIAKSLK